MFGVGPGVLKLLGCCMTSILCKSSLLTEMRVSLYGSERRREHFLEDEEFLKMALCRGGPYTPVKRPGWIAHVVACACSSCTVWRRMPYSA